MAASTGPLRGPRLTAASIRNREFTARRLGGGLDPDDVHQFLDRVAEEVERLTQERVNAQKFPAADAAAREATHILVHARRTGEEVVRNAQETARGITVEAQNRWSQIINDGNNRHESIIARAREQGDQIVTEAAARFPADAQAQIAFLDAFADFLTTHLKGMVEVLENRRPAQAANGHSAGMSAYPAGYGDGAPGTPA